MGKKDSAVSAPGRRVYSGGAPGERACLGLVEWRSTLSRIFRANGTISLPGSALIFSPLFSWLNSMNGDLVSKEDEGVGSRVQKSMYF